ncbi:ATP-NAD kinase-like domain-containing protein [Xylaria scruposa]|nr:ATP-NAD kinase-like domain-containing protein [Xylaria scruposa]
MEVSATHSSDNPCSATAASSASAADHAGAALSPSSILSDSNPSPTTPTPTPNATATVEPASDLTTTTPSHDGDQGRSRPEHAAEGLTSPDSVVSDYNSSNKSPGLPNGSLSIDSVPRQTIIKALASAARNRNNKPEALSLNSMLSTHSAAGKRPSTSAPSSQKLADALNELALQTSTPNTAFPALQSPCFYHNRFDDAVDIDKVLEEIKNDEWMSHSRLVQTATGVREVSKQLQRRPIRRAVRNVMIVTKARDNELVYLTRELAMWLLRTPRYGSDVGVNVYVDAKLRHSKRFGAASIIDEDPRFPSMLHYWSPDLCWSQPEKFDLVCTLGGDGTVLFTSWLFQRIVPPVISFSLGSLGFLTTFEFEKYKQHLNRIMGDEGMRVNLRMRFTCTVYRNGASGGEMEEGEQFEVLNELVIDRGPSPYVSNLELYGDNELLTVVQADGCIFSTPTGSTAYSLSAGGALVHPDIPAILLTPICPHTLSFRPMVLSDTMLLRVSVPRNSRATAYCAFDGKGRVELRQGDHVTITASQYPFPTVMRTNTEWFDSVSRTLQWNTRAATQKGFDSNSGSQAASVKDDEPEWDIDTDSACYASEDGSIAASPLRRQMSLLGM